MKRAYNNWSCLNLADQLSRELRNVVYDNPHPELGAALGLIEVSSYTGYKVSFTGRFRAKVRKAVAATRVNDEINLRRAVWA